MSLIAYIIHFQAINIDYLNTQVKYFTENRNELLISVQPNCINYCKSGYIVLGR